jgi:hypothetical protein
VPVAKTGLIDRRILHQTSAVRQAVPRVKQVEAAQRQSEGFLRLW